MGSGEVSHWWHSVGGPGEPRPALAGSAEADVAIVGGGFTGLWTAYYLKRAEPSLHVLVLEREFAGFGASGRNGGWVSGFFSGPPRVYEHRSGRARLHALQREMFATVEEIASVVERHGIEADLLKGGRLAVALDAAQAERLRAQVADARARGLGEEDLRELSSEELRARVNVAGARAASFSPHAARVHPAKLVAGLARAVEELGVEIRERTPVREISAHAALTPAGTVSARWVVRATEGYTAALPGARRLLVPVNSSMIVTEPLADAAWSEIGWEGAEVLSDDAHVYVYLQRTADGRIAIGGRGIPYRFGSRTDRRGETADSTVSALHGKLRAMFPPAADAAVAHAWSGVLGVSRDWCVSVNVDRDSGLAWAGGYAGEGVAASNLAARTLRDLILDRPSELRELPWVGHRPRRWEPEPLRWAGIRGLYGLYRRADRLEARTGRSSRFGKVLDSLSGRA